MAGTAAPQRAWTMVAEALAVERQAAAASAQAVAATAPRGFGGEVDGGGQRLPPRTVAARAVGWEVTVRAAEEARALVNCL